MAHVQYFPIILEDYQGTSDRPGCETKEDSPYLPEQGHLLHCNTRLQNLTRLDHVLQGALRRCAAPWLGISWEVMHLPSSLYLL